MQTRCGVLGSASWTRGKVSKARMRLVRSRCQRIRAPKLEHEGWQDGARTPFPGTARACRGASSPRKVDGTRAKDLWCVPAGFSQGPVYKSRPGLFTRLGQIGVLGSAGGSMGSQIMSNRAVSKDSQRLRDWTPDEPVDDLLIKSIADSHKPFPDRQSSQFLSGRAFLTKTDPRLTKPSLLKQIADRH